VIERRLARSIQVGGVTVGGTAPVIVQSMTNTDTRNTSATVDQIARLASLGCEIVRIAVPDMQAAQTLAEIKKGSSIPIIADIHFDYRLALAAMESGVDQVRINPGNIGDDDRVRAVVNAAKDRNIPIRIGVNAGSLPKDADAGKSQSEQMVDAVLKEVRLLEAAGFEDIEISCKSFDVPTTVEANRKISQVVQYPLHLGITEAGLPSSGSVRTAVGLGILLYEGIGDSLRVSLSGDPAVEIPVAYDILKSLNLRQRGPTLVSCPSCGRADVDVAALALAVNDRLSKMTKVVTVAVMGCEVNGPGEARHADVGVACGKGRGAIFCKGEIVRTVQEKDLLEALMEEVQKV
jgi:(E)-4-hydroxy-3-methylbut-2-enyl-diphosphate synthase